MDPSSCHKLLGVAASVTLSVTAPLFAMLPTWFGEVKEWGAFAAVVAGLFATLGIGVSAWLKAIRTGQEVKAQQRRDLQEIKDQTESALCRQRQAEGRCPKSFKHRETDDDLC